MAPGAWRAARRFGLDRRAAVAVEFAMLAPIILAMLAGLYDLCQILTVQRRVIEICYTVSDLVAQSKTITSTEVEAILAGAETMMRPYDTDSLAITVSDVTVSDSTATVVWALAVGTTAPSAGDTSTATIPSSIVESGVEIIVAQVTYNFTPLFSDLFGTALTFDRQHLSRPRKSSTVTLD